MRESRSLTQDERSEAARRAIIDAAISVLAEEGYRRTTFTRIQEVAGLSRGLITYHFGSKVKLIGAVITSVRDTYNAEAIEVSAAQENSGLNSVLGMIDSYLQRLTSDVRPASVMLVLAMASDADEPEVRDAVQRRYAEMRAELREWLERGITDGSVRPSVAPGAYAGVLEGMVRGIALQYVIDRQGFDLAGCRSAALAMARSALAGPDTGC
ncbi:TetR/AcrR family transcriptional regulator [Streptomyces bobili]|uniref:TetR/AcrR family transcriptional regulator n=1 Tax=Streptomyces bobili TaxID=67280 RepID=UPI00365EFA80